MKARADALPFIAALLLTAVLASCTRNPETVAQVVPTLAVLPSATPTLGPSPTLTDTWTPVPTLPPTMTATPTLSPVPSITPSVTLTPPPPCDVAAWLNQVDPLIVRFLDVVDIAGVTPRSSLSSVLLEMRQVFRDFQRADHPDCSLPAYNELVAGMDNTAQGYNDFLAQLELSSASDLEVAAAHFWAAAQIIQEYGIEVDPRMLNVSSSVGYLLENAATATWVAEVGLEGLSERSLTQSWNEIQTQDAILNPTLTAIFAPPTPALFYAQPTSAQFYAQPIPPPLYVPPTTSADIPSGGGFVCADGTISYATNRAGACSHHGGVAG